MASDILDIRELDSYTRRMMNVAAFAIPSEQKKFMRQEGTKLKNAVVKEAKRSVKKRKRGKGDTGYVKSFKRGKVYDYLGDKKNKCVRVYNSNPVAHLMEFGHRQVVNPKDPNKKGAAMIGEDKFVPRVKEGKGIGREIGFVSGNFAMEKGERNFQSKFYADCEKFVQNVVEQKLK